MSYFDRAVVGSQPSLKSFALPSEAPKLLKLAGTEVSQDECGIWYASL